MMNLLYKHGSYPHCLQNHAVCVANIKANVKANVKTTNFRADEVK
jgi:hypothetical protein